MADFTQIYNLVNDVVGEMTATVPIKAVDSASFVSLGKTILGDDAYKESFLSSFVHKIGKTVYFAKSYSANVKGIEVDTMKWGYYYGRYKKDIDQAVRNEDFARSNNPTERPLNPTEYKPSTNFDDRWYSGFGVWEYNDVIYGDQLDTAFRSEAEFDGYVTMVYTAMHNSYELSKEGTANEARNTYMLNAKPTQEIKLLTIYNEEFTEYPDVIADYQNGESDEVTVPGINDGDTETYKRFRKKLTRERALQDPEFLRWAFQKIKTTMKLMEKPSKQFNDGTITEWIQPEDMRVDMITDFAEAFKANITAIDFHSDIESLPEFNEVAFWQRNGSGDFLITRGDIKGYVGTGEKREQKTIQNIVAFVHDAKAVVMTSDKPRVVSKYEVLNDRTIISAKGRISYLCDISCNGVIFTLN